MKKLTFILIGAGNRGKCYTQHAYMHGGYELVGIADPNEQTREFMREYYHIPKENCYKTYDELLARGKIADFAMICTQDRLHFAPAMKAIEQGYPLMLEKPVAPTPEECIQIRDAAEQKGVPCCCLPRPPLYAFCTSSQAGNCRRSPWKNHQYHSYRMCWKYSLFALFCSWPLAQHRGILQHAVGKIMPRPGSFAVASAEPMQKGTVIWTLELFPQGELSKRCPRTLYSRMSVCRAVSLQHAQNLSGLSRRRRVSLSTSPSGRHTFYTRRNRAMAGNIRLWQMCIPV